METPHPYAETDLEKIRSIVKKHPFPPMVTDFDVRFGEYDGDPAVWIAFKTLGEAERNEPSVRARGEILHELRLAVQDDLMRELPAWYPFFRFERADTAGGH